MTQDQKFEELVTSFINGNRIYVVQTILSFRKKKLIKFFFYLENNRDWLCSEKVIFDIINSLHNRALV